jgi:hypothetical protein
MRILTQEASLPLERTALAASLRFEPVYWLLPILAGFAGVLLAQRVRRASSGASEEIGKKEDSHAPYLSQPESSASNLPTAVRTFLSSSLLSGLLGVAAAVLLGQFLVGAFVQDVATSRNVAPTQPEVGQIIFGVVAAFAAASFVVKKFGNLGYIWPILASALVTVFVQAVYYRPDTIRQFAETRPAAFFRHSALSLLPIQLVVLGTLGAILGYWMAVRYDWWRTHESNP